jgi:hypothetical protein
MFLSFKLMSSTYTITAIMQVPEKNPSGLGIRVRRRFILYEHELTNFK